MLLENKVRKRISSGKASLGGWCMTASVAACEILAAAGFDWVCIDAEHSSVEAEKLQSMIIAIENQEAEPFVRLALNSEIESKKALDAGASGIIVPMIKSYQDVEKAVSFVKYSPMGSRSFALSRATGYGNYADSYFKSANRWTFLVVMIEHIDAVKELDSIFSNENIDAVLVGPYDLSGSMGIPGDFTNEDFKKVINEIDFKAKKYQVTMGIHEVHPTGEKIARYVKQGYKFIGCGIDTIFINESARNIIKTRET
ncbi:MAG: HpcH/HpaI aldolase family protein [Bacteroidota bacterium]